MKRSPSSMGAIRMHVADTSQFQCPFSAPRQTFIAKTYLRAKPALRYRLIHCCRSDNDGDSVLVVSRSLTPCFYEIRSVLVTICLAHHCSQRDMLTPTARPKACVSSHGHWVGDRCVVRCGRLAIYTWGIQRVVLASGGPGSKEANSRSGNAPSTYSGGGLPRLCRLYEGSTSKVCAGYLHRASSVLRCPPSHRAGENGFGKCPGVWCCCLRTRRHFGSLERGALGEGE